MIFFSEVKGLSGYKNTLFKIMFYYIYNPISSQIPVSVDSFMYDCVIST